MPTDRLSALDASFLHLEDATSHMHVAGVMIFDGEPPDYDELVAAVENRLHLVPRYRQRLAFVPLGQGRPKWVDDPHLNMRYHVRATALPAPGTEEELRALAGRVLSQQLDRDKPLWEMWLVEGLSGNRFAVISKTHHALVDGVSGVDVASVMFDLEPQPAATPGGAEPWIPRPVPSGTDLLAESLVERATAPSEVVRSVRSLLRAPRAAAGAARDALIGVGAFARAGLRAPPDSPYNASLGPHRRFSWIRTSLADVKAIKNELGGTVNDVVLATVAGGLGRHMRRRGIATDGLELVAMVPVSVRADSERGALGNRVSTMMAPLPVWCEDPVTRLEAVRDAMGDLKGSGQAVGAQVLTDIAGFAPPTIMAQATRLAVRRRMFNLVVTNIPGPQLPLYMAGHELRDLFPMVPLARNQCLGVAIMSYNGRMNFGLVGDYDALPDLEDVAEDFRASLAELADAAGVRLTPDRALAARERSDSGEGERAPAAAGVGATTGAETV